MGIYGAPYPVSLFKPAKSSTFGFQHCGGDKIFRTAETSKSSRRSSSFLFSCPSEHTANKGLQSRLDTVDKPSRAACWLALARSFSQLALLTSAEEQDPIHHAPIEAAEQAAAVAKVKETRVLKIGTRPLFLFTTMAGPNLELFKVGRGDVQELNH